MGLIPCLFLSFTPALSVMCAPWLAPPLPIGQTLLITFSVQFGSTAGMRPALAEGRMGPEVISAHLSCPLLFICSSSPFYSFGVQTDQVALQGWLMYWPALLFPIHYPVDLCLQDVRVP